MPKATIDSDGLHISDKEVSEKLEKKSISPSMITALEGCHARWLGETFIVNDVLLEEVDNPAKRGSMFHKVMEKFFARDEDDRTTSAMKETMAEVLQSDEFKDLGNIPEAVSWLKEAVNNYYSMGANPKKVSIATVTDDYGRERKGLEIFVKGNIGDSKRETLGFVDRLIFDPRREGSVVVEDWKTGKVKKWNGSFTKGAEGYAEQRQQMIYSTLLTNKGLEVSGARLIFPLGKEIVNVDLGNTELRDRVIEDVKRTDEALDLLINSNNFEYSPCFLCAWCPLAKICPQADIKPYKKMQDAYATQPDPELFTDVIDFGD